MTTSLTSSLTTSPTSSLTTSPTSSLTTSPTSSTTFVLTTEEEKEYFVVKKKFRPVNIVLISVAACFLLFVFISLFKLNKKKPNNRPSFSYANPIYSYDENNTIREDNNNNENINSFYDDAPPTETTYSDFSVEEQANRYKLGLDPLPTVQTQRQVQIQSDI